MVKNKNKNKKNKKQTTTTSASVLSNGSTGVATSSTTGLSTGPVDEISTALSLTTLRASGVDESQEMPGSAEFTSNSPIPSLHSTIQSALSTFTEEEHEEDEEKDGGDGVGEGCSTVAMPPTSGAPPETSSPTMDEILAFATKIASRQANLLKQTREEVDRIGKVVDETRCLNQTLATSRAEMNALKEKNYTLKAECTTSQYTQLKILNAEAIEKKYGWLDHKWALKFIGKSKFKRLGIGKGQWADFYQHPSFAEHQNTLSDKAPELHQEALAAAGLDAAAGFAEIVARIAAKKPEDWKGHVPAFTLLIPKSYDDSERAVLHAIYTYLPISYKDECDDESDEEDFDDENEDTVLSETSSEDETDEETDEEMDDDKG